MYLHTAFTWLVKIRRHHGRLCEPHAAARLVVVACCHFRVQATSRFYILQGKLSISCFVFRLFSNSRLAPIEEERSGRLSNEMLRLGSLLRISPASPSRSFAQLRTPPLQARGSYRMILKMAYYYHVAYPRWNSICG